nr:hypothetical protein Iba_chr02fCG7910 [Ipomoea batatas]
MDRNTKGSKTLVYTPFSNHPLFIPYHKSSLTSLLLQFAGGFREAVTLPKQELVPALGFLLRPGSCKKKVLDMRLATEPSMVSKNPLLFPVKEALTDEKIPSFEGSKGNKGFSSNFPVLGALSSKSRSGD